MSVCSRTAKKKKENGIMKNKIIKVMCISICMTMLFVSGGVGTTKVLASRETETKNCDSVETPTGTADFER